MIREFIKKIGTGPNGSRDLLADEALRAAGLILDGTATPAQAGAILLGLRLKGETGEEMAGFLEALRRSLIPSTLAEQPDLDIGDPYDGRVKSSSLVVPAALLAARQGLRTVLHGLSGVPVKMGRGVLEVWKDHGFLPTPLSRVGEDLRKTGAVCLSQEAFLPEVARLLPIRRELGLRTILNTVEKAVNPLSAKAQIIGIFHEPIVEKLLVALRTSDGLPAGRVLFVSGVEGGIDLHPHRSTRCFLSDPSGETPLVRLTIPPPPDGTEVPYGMPNLPALLESPDHPFRLSLLRQTALLHFAAGAFASFGEAFASLGEGKSGRA